MQRKQFLEVASAAQTSKIYVNIFAHLANWLHRTAFFRRKARALYI